MSNHHLGPIDFWDKETQVPNLATQSDIHQKEDPETYNSKGDIID
jgi:hypothetical protein